jgi:hypothetical protein
MEDKTGKIILTCIRVSGRVSCHRLQWQRYRNIFEKEEQWWFNKKWHVVRTITNYTFRFRSCVNWPPWSHLLLRRRLYIPREIIKMINNIIVWKLNYLSRMVFRLPIRKTFLHWHTTYLVFWASTKYVEEEHVKTTTKYNFPNMWSTKSLLKQQKDWDKAYKSLLLEFSMYWFRINICLQIFSIKVIRYLRQAS